MPDFHRLCITVAIHMLSYILYVANTFTISVHSSDVMAGTG